MLVLRSAVLRSIQSSSVTVSTRSLGLPSLKLRQFSLGLSHASRFSREFSKLRPRSDILRRPPPTPTRAKPVVENTLLPDFIGLRPGADLLKCLGFTALVGFGSYTIAIAHDFHSSKDKFRKMVQDMNAFFMPHEDPNALSPGQKCALALVAVNCLVTVLWKVKPLHRAMWRYFTNSFASKSLCAPMVLSTFSHSNLLHLGLNMYCLFSFTHLTIDKFLGIDQFLAFFMTAGAVSSFTSLVQKYMTRSAIRSLGASGAILAVLTYTCMMIPDARLSIVFLPQFDFSAKNAVIGILAFDLAGLLFRFRMFDHAAHLGGSLFGIFYAWYGKQLWQMYYPQVVAAYRKIVGSSK